jgi:hypothetical protein
MVAVTYSSARVAAAAAATKTSAPAKKSFFARFLNALMDARLRQAEREIATHWHLVSWNDETIDRSELPFAR